MLRRTWRLAELGTNVGLDPGGRLPATSRTGAVRPWYFAQAADDCRSAVPTV